MIDQYEFEKKLRDVVRRADKFGHNRQTILEEILQMADNYREKAEAIELEMIVADQLRPDNPRYDYGLG